MEFFIKLLGFLIEKLECFWNQNRLHERFFYGGYYYFLKRSSVNLTNQYTNFLDFHATYLKLNYEVHIFILRKYLHLSAGFFFAILKKYFMMFLQSRMKRFLISHKNGGSIDHIFRNDVQIIKNLDLLFFWSK